MFGYKAFHKGLIGYGGFQYEIGKVYEITTNLEFCENGFHFCDFPLDVDRFYHTNWNEIEYCLVEILGNVIHNKKDHMSITNKIKMQVDQHLWDFSYLIDESYV